MYPDQYIIKIPNGPCPTRAFGPNWTIIQFYEYSSHPNACICFIEGVKFFSFQSPNEGSKLLIDSNENFFRIFPTTFYSCLSHAYIFRPPCIYSAMINNHPVNICERHHINLIRYVIISRLVTSAFGRFIFNSSAVAQFRVHIVIWCQLSSYFVCIKISNLKYASRIFFSFVRNDNHKGQGFLNILYSGRQ